MLPARLWGLVLKQIARHRVRTLLTAAGIAVAMFLFVVVQAMQAGVAAATHRTAGDTTLVVYRQNRFCPSTSRLPEHYAARIAQVDGVADVLPLKIVVNNCRTSLDVVTFRGVGEEQLDQVLAGARVTAGSAAAWRERRDAALVGEVLARRRGLSVGQRFDASGITVTVAGILSSPRAQDQNVAYVHLPFLQQAADRRLGTVTQFNVRVSDPSRLDAVARKIDAAFAADPEPTQTAPEQAFVARAAGDLLMIFSFTRYLGWASLAAVAALVANAIVLAVQGRIRENGVLQAVGYGPRLIARLIVAEGFVLGAAGGLVGGLAAVVVLYAGQFTLSSEGLSIPIQPGLAPLATGVVAAAALGVLAGLVPAWQAGQRSVADCLGAR